MESRPSRGKYPRYSPPILGPARGARSGAQRSGAASEAGDGPGSKLLRRPGLDAVSAASTTITLIYAGCPRGQSRMTVLRRELPLSNGASPPARARVSHRRCRGLPIVPAPRADPRSPQDGRPCPLLHVSRYAARATAAGWVSAAQRKPTSSRAHATTATGGASRGRGDAGSGRWSRTGSCQAWARMAGGCPWLRRANAARAAARGGHASTLRPGGAARGCCGLGDAAPLRRSRRSARFGTRPRYAMSCRGMREARESPICASRVIAASVSIPAEAAEPAHRLAVGCRLRQGRDFSVQVRDPGQELFDRRSDIPSRCAPTSGG